MSAAHETSVFISRQKRLKEAMQSTGIDVMIINAGPSLIYLTGLHFHLMERPVVLLFTVDDTPMLVLPELEAGKVSDVSYPLQTCTYGENPATWRDIFTQAQHRLEIEPGSVFGLEPHSLRVLELRLLEGTVAGARYISAEETIARLRMIKDPEEISAMRKAVEVAQNALKATLPHIHAGMSEIEVASELTLRLLRGGSESRLPFEPIVASGPNSANPHAVPSERTLQAGDLVIVDWGASTRGYYSDLTRTFAVGDTNPEFKQIAGIVEEANAAGRMAARPGQPVANVDAAARLVIEKAGYGAYFTHRTGHGLGMEAHEEPYIRGDNPQLLEPGMTFTVEPGIYLPGKGGVRIEDNVVITQHGSESLSDMPRPLRIIG